MSITVKGDANDFVGKGRHGGEIVLTPPARATRRRERVLAGNSVLYGATGGRLFIAGRAGERFAVRNSGALATAASYAHAEEVRGPAFPCQVRS